MLTLKFTAWPVVVVLPEVVVVAAPPTVTEMVPQEPATVQTVRVVEPAAMPVMVMTLPLNDCVVRPGVVLPFT